MLLHIHDSFVYTCFLHARKFVTSIIQNIPYNCIFYFFIIF